MKVDCLITISVLFVLLILQEDRVMVSNSFKAALFNLIVKKHLLILLLSLHITICIAPVLRIHAFKAVSQPTTSTLKLSQFC